MSEPDQRPPTELQTVSSGDGLEVSEAAAATAAPAPPAPPPRRWRLVALVAGGLVLVVAAAVFGPTAVAVVTQRGTTLSAPDDVAGFRRDTSDGARDTADYLQSAISTEVDLDQTIAAVYASDDADATDKVIVVGGTALLWSPEPALDRMFALVADDSGGVEATRSVDPGPLGGVARCGHSRAEGTGLTVCGWADHASVVIVLFSERATDEAAKLLRDLRAEIQHR